LRKWQMKLKIAMANECAPKNRPGGRYGLSTEAQPEAEDPPDSALIFVIGP
jgi:hypothetical protein